VFMRSLLFMAAIVTSLATQAIAQDKSIAAMAWSGAPKTSPRSSTEFEMNGVSECLFRGRKLSVCSWYVRV
jgi:hypothetical protein